MTSIMIGFSNPTHGHFYWDGYTWGVWFSDGSTSILNAAKDFGVTTQGPSLTAYTVPADTVEYSDWWTTPGGETVRKVITTTYEGRSVGGVTYYRGRYYTSNTTNLYPTKLAAAQGAYTEFVAYNSCTHQSSYGSGLWYTFEYINEVTNRYYLHEWTNNPPFTCSGLTSIGVFSEVSWYVTPVTVTLHYLDTHIVWTYEIV